MADSSAPKISCLVPVYNGERYLEEALRSIVEQTFDDWEMIVVNDGSTDGSLNILQSLARQEPRIRVIDQPNTGIVGALNRGLQDCRGQYIARMDADDICLVDRFAHQVAYLDSHPDCVCVGGVAIEFTDAEGPGRHTTGGRHRTSDLTIFPPKIAVAMHPLIMVRRDALQAIGGYRSDYPHAEDYDLYIRLAARGTIDNPEIPMLWYRRHEGAVSLKHLELQERSAARAEVDGYALATGRTVPEITLEAYEALRIWRRYISLKDDRAGRMLRGMIGRLLRTRPIALWDAEYNRIRLLIAASLVRFTRLQLKRAG